MMRARDVAGNSQTEAGSSRLCSKERFKEMCGRLGRDRPGRVDDIKFDDAVALRSSPKRYPIAMLASLDCVESKVQ